MAIPMNALAIAGLLLNAAVGVFGVEDDSLYAACPLIRAYYPPPTITKSSDGIAQLRTEFTEVFDKLIQDGGSEIYGPIMPNTTSFSVVLFSGAEPTKDDPIFFEYHYTSPRDQSATNDTITSDSKLPVGDLTMIFTVYAWLVEMGDNWETSITEYLPELGNTKGSAMIPWQDVTIGALAGHMLGLIPGACVIGESCDWKAFVDELSVDPFIFLPDTTPMISYTAFQLLAFAMQRSSGAATFSSVLQKSILKPLNMTASGLLSHNVTDLFAIGNMSLSQVGEPGALSLFSSIRDLSRAGHAMLSSSLVNPAITRRWLHHSTDTSNLRNGVGRPWEIYRSGASAISPVVDALTKSATVSQYASYFGLAADFNVGFAILAHDSTVADRKLDLNVHADVVSETLGHLQQIAAKETDLLYSGMYGGNDSVVILNMTKDGPGLAVQELRVNGVNLKDETARKLGIRAADMDFRLYPTTVRDSSRHQFVAVFQDRNALIDAGTPTCITWQEVGALAGAVYRFVFELEEDGKAGAITVMGKGITLRRNGGVGTA